MPQRQRLSQRVKSFAGQSAVAFQGILAGIAVSTSIVFWFFEGSSGFLNNFVYTFIAGNFTALAMGTLGGIFLHPSPLRRWIGFLALLLPIGLIGGTLGTLAVYFLPGAHGPLLAFLLVNVKIGLFINMIASISLFIASTTQGRLEAANRLLQDQVQLGVIRLQDHTAELTTAHEIQAHLIPTNLPRIPGVQASGAWQPAQAVGGDYFDAIPFSRTRLALCIADVSGKGMGAALLMANMQAAFRAFATDDTRPSALCEKLNRALCSSIAPGKFVTFVYGIIDTSQMMLQYANAGHNEPILLRAGVASSWEGGGTVLGLFPDAQYPESTIPLQPGDCLLLTTDGITEAAHPNNLDDEFGEDRLIKAAQQVRSEGAHAIRSRILEEVTKFCDGQFQDDASLIVVTLDERG